MRRFRFVIWLMAMLAAAAMPAVSIAQIISITIAPPVLPVYVQPPIPAPGYIWAPGYWHYGPLGYYWVPGTWVLPPAIGLLWTPGYWGWQGGVYAWSVGYWGPHIGFYGGVNYGFGYGGVGYEGGYWNNGVFSYNRTVNNFGNTNITNVYNKTVINNTNVTRTSFNGGKGGTTVKPTPQEQVAAREQHVAVTKEQAQHQQAASTNKALLASENHGRPAIAATAKPGEFTGEGVVPTGKPGTAPRGTTPPIAKVAPVGAHPKAPAAGEGSATPNGKTPPKPLNTPPAHKPVVAAPPPPHVAVPVRPPPHATAPARPPHVAAPVRPPPPHAAAPGRPPPHVAAPVRPPAKPAPQAHPAPNGKPPG